MKGRNGSIEIEEEIAAVRETQIFDRNKLAESNL